MSTDRATELAFRLNSIDDRRRSATMHRWSAVASVDESSRSPDENPAAQPGRRARGAGRDPPRRPRDLAASDRAAQALGFLHRGASRDLSEHADAVQP